MAREEEPAIERILETALYVEDVERSARFYRDLLGLKPLTCNDHFVALHAGSGTVLLLFEQGSALKGGETEGGWIPPHDGDGGSHIAFAVASGEELDRWVTRLRGANVPIESCVRWPRGGASVYVRDPDGHSVELATPGIWPVH